MAALVATVFVSSLLGSLHCAGMCGGFVAFYAGSDRSSGPARLRPHVAYNLGRFATYLALGAVSGAAGAALDRAGALAGVSRAASILAGAVMVVWGGLLLLQSRGVRIRTTWVPRGLSEFVGRRVASLGNRPPTVRALALGLLSTLLPCGWLYAFVATAGGAGSPVAGASVMALFWLGTLPVMLALGAVAQGALGRIARYVPIVTSAVLLVFGLLTVFGRMTPSRVEAALRRGSVPAAVQGVPAAPEAGGHDCR